MNLLAVLLLCKDLKTPGLTDLQPLSRMRHGTDFSAASVPSGLSTATHATLGNGSHAALEVPHATAYLNDTTRNRLLHVV